MDLIEKIGHSTIQHGKENNRIYLLKYSKEDPATLAAAMDELAKQNKYGKIIAKVPASAQPFFLQAGYTTEAYIPNFYSNDEDVFFMVRYPDERRSIITNNDFELTAGLLSGSPNNNNRQAASKFKVGITSPNLADEMAKLYSKVFESYPFPITDPAYLAETMQNGSVIYFGLWDNEQLIALSSAELDTKNKNAEMTDFAVLPEHRGQNLAGILLAEMEGEMIKHGYKTLYTIARVQSPGMNRTFIKQGYHFSGLLKNNTNISGKIESMNVYYKCLKR